MPPIFDKNLQLDYLFRMPLCPQQRLLFVHVPKTAGSSLEIVFGLQQEDKLWSVESKVEFEGVLYSPQHLPYRRLIELVPEASDYFSFSCVRNPITRAVSEYFYFHWSHFGKRVEFDEGLFQRWLERDVRQMNIDHFLPQFDLVGNEIDQLLRFEKLSDDFSILKNTLGRSDLFLIHENRQNSHDKSAIAENLKKKSLEIIYGIYEKDFDAFSYPSRLSASSEKRWWGRFFYGRGG